MVSLLCNARFAGSLVWTQLCCQSWQYTTNRLEWFMQIM